MEGDTIGGDTGVAFNGINDFVDSGGGAPLSLTGNPSFTIETLVFIPTGASALNYPTFLHWGAPGTANSVFFGLRRFENNKIYAGFYNGGQMMSGTIALDEWHHIVMVRNGGGNSATGTTLYVDGASVALTPDTLLPSPILTPTLTSTTFRINRATDDSRVFTGSMDELALYDRVLSESEVEAHFNALTIPEPSTVILLCLAILGMLVYGWHRPKKVA